MKFIKKLVCAAILICGVVTVLSSTSSVSAASSYVYDYWKNVIPSSEGLTYKDTYYYSDITNQAGTKHLDAFDTIIDMETYDEAKTDANGNQYYESTLYVLDQNASTATPITLNGKTFDETGLSKIIVIDQNFNYVTVQQEFLITDEVKEKLDEFYHFGTWSGLSKQDQIQLSDITQKMFESEELVDVYDVVDMTSTVGKNSDTGELFVTLDQISYNTNRGSSLVLYNGDAVIDSSKYHVELVSALEFSYLATDTATSSKYSVDKVVQALEKAGINVIASHSSNSYEEEILNADGKFTITTGDTRSFSLKNDGFKNENAVCTVYVNDNVITSDNYTIDQENGTLTFNQTYLSSLADAQYTVKCTIDLGQKEYVNNFVTVATEDGNAAKNVFKSVSMFELKDVTYVTFDDLKEGTEVRAIYKYITIPGRAPYVPYSQDNTKAAIYLKKAMGITVTDDAIYVADTENSRIVKLNKDFVVVDVILTPEDSSFYQVYNATYKTEYGDAVETIKNTTSWYQTINDILVFKPRKVAVTPSGVCYCIAESAYQGLLEFGENGLFNRYLGKNTVTVSAIKQLWSNIWTDEQYETQSLDLPSMFNNLAISSDGFLYATSDPDTDATTNLNLVKVINTKGNDILKRNGYVKPDGDAVYLTTSTKEGVILGSSLISAVAVSKSGNYSVTDQRRGRIFTYDEEGNLLYVTGNQPGGIEAAYTGGLSSTLVKPVAIDYFYRSYTGENNSIVNEETVIVLDQSSQTILLYETTEFGEAVNKATELYQNGQIYEAEDYWKQVIKMNTNYELAYLGIGKSLNRAAGSMATEDAKVTYKEAMYYFKLAHNPTYYSKAFSSYRDIVLNQNFNLIMTIVILFVIAIIVGKVTQSIIKKNQERAKANAEGGEK